MITKKLAVPLVNEKILAQAQHCYIATSRITDAGFDFIRGRIPTTCKMSIVTSLDGATSPNVLQRILRHYQGRITLNIYTRSVLNANLYVFDLPFRKSVAFVGSGSVSLEGLKDHEELFWKVSDAKEIESLMSWYTSYFEFGTTLSEGLVREYEHIYPQVLKRETTSRRDKEIAIRLSNFSLEGVRFRAQYFKKEDFSSLAPANGTPTEKITADQESLKEKLIRLSDNLKVKTPALPSQSRFDAKTEGRIQSYEIAFSKTDIEVNAVAFGINPFEMKVSLVLGTYKDSFLSRQQLQLQMKDDAMRTSLFNMISSLGEGYTIEALGVRKSVTSLSTERMLVELLESDYGFHLPIFIEKSFSPGDVANSEDKITETFSKELNLLSGILSFINDKK